MNRPILLIMAAGMGSRYGGTKQIDPISNENDIIMDFSLYDAYKAGFRRVVFVIKKDFENVFKEHITNGAGKYFETNYVYQETTDIPDGFIIPIKRHKPWGTGHAVLSAREYIDAPFAVINADDYYGRDAFEKMYRFLSSKADASHYCMAGYRIQNTLSENGTVARGICCTSDGKLSDIEEHVEVSYETSGEFKGMITGTDTKGIKHTIKENTPVSMNFWGFAPEFINVLKEKFPIALTEIIKTNPEKGEFFLPSCVDAQIKDKKASVDILLCESKWFGVTYKNDKPLVIEQIKKMKSKNIYPKYLWQKI